MFIPPSQLALFSIFSNWHYLTIRPSSPMYMFTTICACRCVDRRLRFIVPPRRPPKQDRLPGGSSCRKGELYFCTSLYSPPPSSSSFQFHPIPLYAFIMSLLCDYPPSGTQSIKPLFTHNNNALSKGRKSTLSSIDGRSNLKSENDIFLDVYIIIARQLVVYQQKHLE